MILKKITLPLLLLIPAFANGETKEYFMSSKKRITVSISESSINRIAIDKDRILKIVGNEAEYLLESDPTRGDVFITSKIGSGGTFFVTLESEKGIVQDIAFQVEDKKEPALVILKPSPQSKLEDMQAKIIKSIREVLTQDLGSYRTRELNINRTINTAKFPVTVVKILEHTNKDFRILEFKCHTIQKFNYRDLAVFFPNLLAMTNKDDSLIVVLKL